MSTYIVGNGFNMWSLEKAIQVAAPGDVIELQSGFCPNCGRINIKKDITLRGCVAQNENGALNYYNTIYGQIFVSDGANVTLQNLWIQMDKEKINVLNCENGKINGKNIVLKNDITEGELYPILYAAHKSTINLEGIEIIENADYSHRAYLNDCEVSINEGTFTDCKIIFENTEAKITKSLLSSYTSNTCSITKSNVTFYNTTLIGADGEKEFPAVWCKDSNVVLTSCTVTQPQYVSSIFLKSNNYLELNSVDATSVKILGGRALIQGSVIRETIQVLNQSYAYLQGETHIYGENSTKVNLYVDKKSVVQAETVYFYRASSPATRVLNHSLMEIKEVFNKNGNVSDLGMDNDETSRLIFNAMESTQTNVQNNKEENSLSAREQLEQMIGLASVKNEIHKMLRMVEFNQQRIANGLEPQEQSYHAVFMGNPGTGKTTVARLIGEVLFESGAFKSDEFKLIEASEPDFISQNVGGTAKQTLALLEKAKGGVLFIDEAYALNKKGQNVDFGIEAINTILKYMEDHRDEIMIIFAGYTKEMEQFLKTNPGLKSRVPNTFVFEDYSADEIVEIGIKELSTKQYIVEDKEYYAQNVKRAYKNSLDHSNARWIRNFNEKLVKVLADRVVDEGGDLVTILKRDIENVMAQSKYKNLSEINEDAMESLQKLIGIEMVKNQVEQFVSLAELNQRREEEGLENGDFTLHSLFLGNPGTGKTTVARIIGEILYQKGIIAEKKFVEVSQSDLIAGHVGQTAIKTKEVLESALGGVLFIDEAYAITQGGGQFGTDAVNEILKFMEDHRRDIVIILAGYTKEMNEFMSTNSGLVSRVPHTFNFEDYTVDELVQIGLLSLRKNGYEIDEDYYGQVVKACYQNSNDHSNGRWIRNLNEKLIMIMSKRISGTADANLSLIINEDMDFLAEIYEVIMNPQINDTCGTKENNEKRS